MSIDKAYALFYIEGREEKILKNDIDTAQLAEKFLDGADLRTLCIDAARVAAKPLEVGRRKKDWIEDSKEDIDEAGGDADKAYANYLEGRVDELASDLESDVIEDLTAMISGEDDEDGEDEEDDEEDDDKEGDDDDK